MKTTALKLIGVVLSALVLTAQASGDEATLKTREDMESYALGVDIARNFKRQGVDFNPDLVLRGMKDALAGDRILFSEADLRTALNMLSSRVRTKEVEARLMAQHDNKEKGVAFLAENKTKPGVVTLPSGLQYKVLKAGNGKKPTETDIVEFFYKGTRIDGTEFDSSQSTGNPATFKVSEVIPAWREAFKLMPQGSKWQLFVPPELAYGQRGSAGIGPYETVIYEIELVGIR
jgi:FKBP-type peptidyl-prolyl cis-trans isomerase